MCVCSEYEYDSADYPPEDEEQRQHRPEALPFAELSISVPSMVRFDATERAILAFAPLNSCADQVALQIRSRKITLP